MKDLNYCSEFLFSYLDNSPRASGSHGDRDNDEIVTSVAKIKVIQSHIYDGTVSLQMVSQELNTFKVTGGVLQCHHFNHLKAYLNTRNITLTVCFT